MLFWFDNYKKTILHKAEKFQMKLWNNFDKVFIEAIVLVNLMQYHDL